MAVHHHIDIGGALQPEGAAAGRADVPAGLQLAIGFLHRQAEQVRPALQVGPQWRDVAGGKAQRLVRHVVDQPGRPPRQPVFAFEDRRALQHDVRPAHRAIQGQPRPRRGVLCAEGSAGIVCPGAHVDVAGDCRGRAEVLAADALALLAGAQLARRALVDAGAELHLHLGGVESCVEAALLQRG
jgi:hypothetical protein